MATPPVRSPVDVVIPSWNGEGVIASCLQSLIPLAATRVIVVDNASTDETRTVVSRIAPLAHLIRHDHNQGFAAACNRGIRESGAPYVLLLNQDTEVIPSGLTALLRYAEHAPRVAALGGRIENRDGTLQPSMGPIPDPIRVVLDRMRGVRRFFPTHVYRHPGWYASAQNPGWLTGACLLLRRAAVEDIGLLDQSYFMYTEDLEWCTRARKKGWTLQFVPVPVATHADDGKRPDRSLAKARWMREGLEQYFRQHGTRRQRWMFRALRRIEELSQPSLRGAKRLVSATFRPRAQGRGEATPDRRSNLGVEEIASSLTSFPPRNDRT